MSELFTRNFLGMKTRHCDARTTVTFPATSHKALPLPTGQQSFPIPP